MNIVMFGVLFSGIMITSVCFTTTMEGASESSQLFAKGLLYSLAACDFIVFLNYFKII